MGEKKKNKDRERSEQKKKSKKKSKQQKRDKQSKKRKNDRRKSSSSSESSSDTSSQSSRSRQKQKKSKKKKKQKQKQSKKQQKQNIVLPFAIPQAPVVIANPLTTIRPGTFIPPPAPTTQPVIATNKPKTKQYHIFKLLPKLSIGCTTIARTLYSSQYFSEEFEQKMYNQMCQQIEKQVKAEGPKKMINLIGKLKNQINSFDYKPKQLKNSLQEKPFENQFDRLNSIYNKQMNSLKQKYIQLGSKN